MKGKLMNLSVVTMTELVLPHHTNTLGNLLGGQLMHWIDICAALAAQKHSSRTCVTASVDKIDFHHPVRLGEIVTLIASVNRVFNTSMEVGVKVYTESYIQGTKTHSNSAYLTFVGVDGAGKPVPAIPVIPETAEEKRRFDEALVRRDARLSARKPLS
ncbi:MAG: acyl-CoA thioesterase [Ignavibacteriales bacterium]|nr:hypothetical protein [Ignavibacteriaceae bacterium]QOJ30222.1 MAG: acyl-CoA thioesterase [Ignavibacteriales bacterium]